MAAPRCRAALSATRNGSAITVYTDNVAGTTAGMAGNLTYVLSDAGTANLTIASAVVSGQLNCTAGVGQQPGSTVDRGRASAWWCGSSRPGRGPGSAPSR